MTVKEPNWADGLSSRVAGALRKDGFTDRERLMQAILDGEIVRGRGKRSFCLIPNIGMKGLRELYAWLGITSDDDLNARRAERQHRVAIEKAIALLEGNNYRVYDVSPGATLKGRELRRMIAVLEHYGYRIIAPEMPT